MHPPQSKFQYLFEAKQLVKFRHEKIKPAHKPGWSVGRLSGTVQAYCKHPSNTLGLHGVRKYFQMPLSSVVLWRRRRHHVSLFRQHGNPCMPLSVYCSRTVFVCESTVTLNSLVVSQHPTAVTLCVSSKTSTILDTEIRNRRDFWKQSNTLTKGKGEGTFCLS
ncbi:hypothetical protein J6590_052219 [Homalodisca vitripennis]|nr:hypothetical protein J6590_052219 [Homalodisca vitripennis]